MIHSCIWPLMRQKEYSMSIFCVKWKWKCGCLVGKYQCQHYHSAKNGISYQQHRIAIGCFNGRSLPSGRGELNPSAPSGVWQGLFLCHLVFSLAFNVSSSECWAATGYSQKVLNLIKQFPSGLLTPVAPSGVWQATACHLVVNQACGGEAFIMCFIWGIVVAILLLRSCVESNPGPEVEQLYDLLSREAAYNTIFIYQSIWPNLIRVLHICVHIPTHPKLWDKTIWWTKVGVKEH